MPTAHRLLMLATRSGAFHLDDASLLLRECDALTQGRPALQRRWSGLVAPWWGRCSSELEHMEPPRPPADRRGNGCEIISQHRQDRQQR
jgi:hypothetical protein